MVIELKKARITGPFLYIHRMKISLPRDDNNTKLGMVLAVFYVNVPQNSGPGEGEATFEIQRRLISSFIISLRHPNWAARCFSRFSRLGKN